MNCTVVGMRLLLLVCALKLSGCFVGQQQMPSSPYNPEYEACQGPDFDKFPDLKVGDPRRVAVCTDLGQSPSNTAECGPDVTTSPPKGHPCLGIMPVCKLRPEAVDARCRNDAWKHIFTIRPMLQDCGKWGLCGTRITVITAPQ